MRIVRHTHRDEGPLTHISTGQELGNGADDDARQLLLQDGQMLLCEGMVPHMCVHSRGNNDWLTNVPGPDDTCLYVYVCMYVCMYVCNLMHRKIDAVLDAESAKSNCGMGI